MFSGVGHQNCRVDNYSLSGEQYRVPKLKRMRINRTQWGNEFSHWVFVIVQRRKKNVVTSRSGRLKIVLKKCMSLIMERIIMKRGIQCREIETDAIQFIAFYRRAKVQKTDLSEKVAKKTLCGNGPSWNLFVWGIEFSSSNPENISSELFERTLNLAKKA